MNLRKYILCVFILLLDFSSGDHVRSLESEQLLEDIWKLSEASNRLGFNLLVEIAKQTSRNVIFSPVSISTTFGLIYLGARGSTAKELENVLGYKEVNLTRSKVAKAFQNLLTNNLVTVEHRAYVLDVATAIFINENFNLKPSFSKEAKEFLRSPVESVRLDGDNRKAINRINEFVRNRTRNKIYSIVDYLDTSVDLVAVNALYFKSRWTYPFSEANTRQGIFYNRGIIPKNVPMMIREDYYIYYSDDDLSLVNLGFWGRNMSMFVALPHKMNGLAQLEMSLSHSSIKRYLVSSFPKPLKLILPKFNFSHSSELSPTLHSLGAKEIFETRKANLTGMVDEDNIALGAVKHKALIEVNENGVEATGVTAVMSFKSMPLPGGFADTFTVNRPFLFFILDERTDLIILLGRVTAL